MFSRVSQFLAPCTSPLFFPAKRWYPNDTNHRGEPESPGRCSSFLHLSSSYFCVKPESIRLLATSPRIIQFLLVDPPHSGPVFTHSKDRSLRPDLCGKHKLLPYISSIFFWPPIDPYGLQAFSSSSSSSRRIETKNTWHIAVRPPLRFELIPFLPFSFHPAPC